MTTLYNLRHSADNNFIITKFVDGEVESSYELAANLRECACPAGHRASCRHRQMAPMMLASGIVDTHYFWDYDLNRAVDFNGTLKSNFDAMEELANKPMSMEEALIADGEKLRALTGEDHGPYFVAEGPPSEPLVAADRKTFIIPDGHEAVRDAEGRATGELVAKPWRRL